MARIARVGITKPPAVGRWKPGDEGPDTRTYLQKWFDRSQIVHGVIDRSYEDNNNTVIENDPHETGFRIQNNPDPELPYFDQFGPGGEIFRDDYVDPDIKTGTDQDYFNYGEPYDVVDPRDVVEIDKQIEADAKEAAEARENAQTDTQKKRLGFVDAQKAAGWQYYEDMRRAADPNYQHQVNPYTNSKDSAAVPDIPPETYDEKLLIGGRQGPWDQLQNMAFIVREVAALGPEGAMANYKWLPETLVIAEKMLGQYAVDFPNFSEGTGGLTTTAGDGGTPAGTTGQPNAGRTSSAAGDVIANWAVDVYGHTERDLGASYVKEGGGAVDGWWIPYVPAELNPNSIFLALSNAMLPYLSQTDRQLMGNQMNVFNDEVFANYNAVPQAVMGGENWDDFFNGDRWRNMGLTLKALETALRAKAGGDQALIGSGLMPLRWLIRGIEALQMYVGDNITRLNKEKFQRTYESLMRSAEGQGAAGLDAVFALLVNPYVPGLESFWDEAPNVAIL